MRTKPRGFPVLSSIVLQSPTGEFFAAGAAKDAKVTIITVSKIRASVVLKAVIMRITSYQS
jgi:hypothetical protein